MLNNFQKNILREIKPGEDIKVTCCDRRFIYVGRVESISDDFITIAIDNAPTNHVIIHFDNIDDVEFYWNNDEKSIEHLKKDPMVAHPNHYQSSAGLEVWDVIEAFTSDLSGVEAFDTGNCIKYICRWHKKNGLQDLKKCKEYLEHLIKHIEEKEND